MKSRVSFGSMCRENAIASVAIFGDSISVGAAASTPDRRWTALFAAATGTHIVDRALSGTVLQNTPDASGTPRPDNGLSRAHRDLIAEPADAICVLYGYNDARYTAAPESFNSAGFERDYRSLISLLLGAGFAPETIALGSPPYPSDKGFGVGSEGFTGATRKRFVAHVDAVRRIARAFGLYYAPVYETMASYPDGSLSSPDVTHPNDEGHRLIAEAFLEARIQD